MSLAPRRLHASAISMSVPPVIVKSSTIRTFLPSTWPTMSSISAFSSWPRRVLLPKTTGAFIISPNLYACLPNPTSGAATTRSGIFFGPEVIDQHGHGIEVIDRDLEEPLDLRAVKVHRQHPVGPGRLDAIGADPRPDRDPRLVLLVPLGVGEIRDHRGDLRRAGPLEGVDPEEQLDEVVVDRVVDALDDEDVAAPDVLEHADEDVPFAEDMVSELGQLHAQPAADGLAELLARAAGEHLQLAVRIGLLRGFVVADQRFVHAHGGRSAESAAGGAGSIPRPNGLPVPWCAPPVLRHSALPRTLHTILTSSSGRRQFG